MTITAMAKQLNVSTMTIYRRCKKNGVNVDELRDASSGELSPAGVAVIASMFDATTPQQATTDDATRVQLYNDGDVTNASQAACAVLQARLDGANAVIEQLTGERDELRRQVAALQAALAAEQQDRQQERRLLTGGADDSARGHRWRWPWARR